MPSTQAPIDGSWGTVERNLPTPPQDECAKWFDIVEDAAVHVSTLSAPDFSAKPQRRHTFASTLLMAGRTAPEVAKRCGHAGPDVTNRVYAHWLKGDLNEEALAALAEDASPG